MPCAGERGRYVLVWTVKETFWIHFIDKEERRHCRGASIKESGGRLDSNKNSNSETHSRESVRFYCSRILIVCMAFTWSFVQDRIYGRFQSMTDVARNLTVKVDVVKILLYHRSAEMICRDQRDQRYDELFIRK
ncbi:hypothetical protein KP509_05G092000 [Ceratopteris richardii]|nr:hypothetical protein KP509_05G092000 [Ceratopteris richardii]